jgi:cyclase
MKRIIPVLLIQNGGVVKSIKFKNHRYIGDPINAVKIFNEKEVDEIVILDIDASKNKTGPNLKLIKEIASEAFMPLSYGGGLSSLDQIKHVLNLGVEKVVLNTAAWLNPEIIEAASFQFGSSSIVVSIDLKKTIWGGYKVFVQNGQKSIKESPLDYSLKMLNHGAGEVFLNFIDRDGTYSGYDIPYIKSFCENLNVPVIAAGGAAKEDDLVKVIVEGKASAAAAGSIFVYNGVHKAVLISYPNWSNIQKKIREYGTSDL